jgi:hypothetical protein
MHAGLLFGIYGDSGKFTCEGRAGSFGHEVKDAMMFAEWGVGTICEWSSGRLTQFTAALMCCIL